MECDCLLRWRGGELLSCNWGAAVNFGLDGHRLSPPPPNFRRVNKLCLVSTDSPSYTPSYGLITCITIPGDLGVNTYRIPTITSLPANLTLN